MRILVVGQTVPWPETSGASIRLANVIRGLARLGDVDLFAYVHLDADPRALPDVLPVRRVRIVPKPVAALTLGRRLAWFVAGRRPAAFAGRDYRDLRRRYRQWGDSYDLVWLSRVESYVALGATVRGRVILDMDDLEDYKLSAQLAVERGTRRRTGRRRALAAWATERQGARNIRLWRGLQAEVAAAVDAVVLCSELDRGRLGVGNAAVIPNGYDVQERPRGRIPVGQPPTILFVGSLLYPPNVDAASFLAGDVFPLITRHLPTARLHIVGGGDGRLNRLQGRPGVVLRGLVPDITTELALADIVAVPVRAGSGTRIKILEAFAHRIPVVSTSIGAEGIGAAPGREIEIADTAEAFADGCVRLLTDAAYRIRLADGAFRLFQARYRWDHIQGQVATLGRAVADQTFGGLNWARPDGMVAANPVSEGDSG